MANTHSISFSSAASVKLTPFEEQVLQAMYEGIPQEYLLGDDWELGELHDQEIVRAGRQMFGNQWGGTRRTAQGDDGYGVYDYYPLVNCFLGRMRNKGLIHQVTVGTSFSHWKLSNLGREILGA